MRKAVGILTVLLILAPIVILFQNFTVMPTYDRCRAQLSTNYEWGNEVQVIIDGFNGHMMEPKLSFDQNVIFFNDKPTNDQDMNLHYAIRQPTGRYQYAGILSGTYSPALDGVPAIDGYNRFYFTSTRDWLTTTGSIFGGQLQLAPGGGLMVSNPIAVDRNLPRKAPGEIEMDIDITFDGKTAVSSRAFFSDNKPYPDKSYLRGFSMNNFIMSSNAMMDYFLTQVNRPECVVYAPNISPNQLELYYTVYEQGRLPSPDRFYIVVSKRSSVYSVFSRGSVIAGVRGQLSEAPSLTTNDGGRHMLYHKKDLLSGQFRIYKLTRNIR